jgi:hypothetical protein
VPTVQHRRVAAVLGVEAALAVGVGVWQLIGVSAGGAESPEVAWGSLAWFVLVGAALLGLAWACSRGSVWVYGPAVFVQVLSLPLAVSMAVAGLWVGAVLLGGIAGTGLWLLVSPAGREAFERARLEGS